MDIKNARKILELKYNFNNEELKKNINLNIYNYKK